MADESILGVGYVALAPGSLLTEAESAELMLSDPPLLRSDCA